MQPNAAGDYRPPMALEADDYGFVVPSLGDDDGIFPAGVAAAPHDVSLSVQSATAAALKAIQVVGGRAGATKN